MADGMMKALTHRRYGGPEVVELTEIDIPEPTKGELRVQVHASAVNSADWRLRAAAFPGILAIPGRLMFGVTAPRNPRMGSEFSGIVDTIGAGVTRFAPGDRVYGIMTSGGASAEYLTIAETAAISTMPKGTSYEEAAILPFGGLCALSFLADIAGLASGQRLLVIGASGGVGCYAVQIGKALGAHVTGVCRARSHELVTALGADEVIDYQSEPVATWPGAYDVIFDTYGAISPGAARELLSERGLFLPLNFGLREIGAALLNPLRDRKLRLAVNEDTAEGLARLTQMVEVGQLRPVVDGRYPLECAADAHRDVEGRHRQGATVLIIRPS